MGFPVLACCKGVTLSYHPYYFQPTRTNILFILLNNHAVFFVKYTLTPFPNKEKKDLHEPVYFTVQ